MPFIDADESDSEMSLGQLAECIQDSLAKSEVQELANTTTALNQVVEQSK